ncbi:MAG: hypothetical protein GX926_04340, partial [Candidatus Magasanikbacteria bacterium]|nr:hypothetical protein [Candidatus Magasanikbacteria bacterium]
EAQSQITLLEREMDLLKREKIAWDEDKVRVSASLADVRTVLGGMLSGLEEASQALDAASSLLPTPKAPLSPSPAPSQASTEKPTQAPKATEKSTAAPAGSPCPSAESTQASTEKPAQAPKATEKPGDSPVVSPSPSAAPSPTKGK